MNAIIAGCLRIISYHVVYNDAWNSIISRPIPIFYRFSPTYKGRCDPFMLQQVIACVLSANIVKANVSLTVKD